MTVVLHGDVQPRGDAAVRQLIDGGLIRSAVYFAKTASTSTAALDQIRDRSVHQDDLPRLYLADQQSAGRGRHGRTWQSDSDALTFSLVMRRSVDTVAATAPTTTLWPIAVGVALARSIEFCFAPLRAQLKWPNDVYIGGGKVAGILLETTQGTPETVVVGIGVNTNHAPDTLESTNFIARSIATVAGRTVDRYELLPIIIEQVVDATHQAETEPQTIVQEYRRRCFLSGKMVGFQRNGSQETAMCRGINAAGELLLEQPDSVHACNTGEVNLVRVHDA